MPCAMETPSTRLHVDELILDYLLWYSTETLLIERSLRRDPASPNLTQATRNADTGIKLVNTFHATFSRLHPSSSLPAPISLRFRIARFAAMLLRRIDLTAPSFAPCTEARRRRTEGWLRRRRESSVLPPAADALFGSATPFSPASIDQNAGTLLESIGHTPGTLYGPATLADAMWEFLLMTTPMCARYEEVSSAWMEVLGEFMQQAALEAYRVFGASGVEGLDESFAVGLTEMEFAESESVEELVVNEMFAGEEGQVGEEFEELRMEFLEEILPKEGRGLQEHFDILAKENPWSEFEERVVKFLTTATRTQANPTLSQLENGRLEGFDTRDVQAVLANAGANLQA